MSNSKFLVGSDLGIYIDNQGYHGYSDVKKGTGFKPVYVSPVVTFGKREIEFEIVEGENCPAEMMFGVCESTETRKSGFLKHLLAGAGYYSRNGKLYANKQSTELVKPQPKVIG